jgi:hypothetical protein
VALTIYQAAGTSWELDRLREPCHSDDMETLRWQVGDATVIRIAELDAAAALQGLIPKFDLADIARAQWLTSDFVDECWSSAGIGAGVLDHDRGPGDHH